MSGRHANWRHRWKVDHTAHAATHENGLIVRIADGVPRTLNEPTVRAALLPAHGHNTDNMIERLVREASALIEGRPYGR